VLSVGTAVGAITGLAVGTSLGGLSLAILAGFLGTTIGAVVRNFIVSRAAGMGPDDARTPWLVIVYAAVASLAASAAALELAKRSDLADSPVWIGTLAGLFAAILMAMLMITYHTKPGEMPKPRR
jgi:protein-S-isoprenylcysteine O-methyltransferase Ste14